MKYQPETLIWEFTMGCNLRCRHCGSSCENSLPGELSTEEALTLVDDIAKLKPKWISLSGGEPLLREDWYLVANKFREHDISVRMISNGLLIDKNIAQKMKESGIDMVSISLDGTEEYHDYMRGKGTFQKSKEAFKLLKEYHVPYGSNTTFIRENIGCLEELRDELLELGVSSWQLQPGIPEGNLAKQRESIISVTDIERLIDFSLEENQRGKIRVVLAESIGYYTRKESLSRTIALNALSPVIWKGCNAGIRSFGILHNGDIVGCTSIRRPEFVEGNIRTRSLVDIWNDEKSFSWRRNFSATDLTGICKSCTYSHVCLGGCSNMRIALNDSLSSENQMCVYNHFCNLKKTNTIVNEYVG